MISSQYFSKASRLSVNSKQQPFSSNRLSYDSQYCTEGGIRKSYQDSELQCYLPQSNSCCNIDPLKRTINFGQEKSKKVIKTIKLKTHLKSESNQNDFHNPEKGGKTKTRLNTDSNYQSIEKPFGKFKMAQNNSSVIQSNGNSRLKSFKNSKACLLNSGVIQNLNPTSRNPSHITTCRNSSIYSVSPIKDNIKLEVKLKKVETLYENSIKNYKDILIKLEIEVQKTKLVEKEKLRIKSEKQLLESFLKQKEALVRQKDQTIKQKQKSIIETQKMVKQKQLIINAKNEEFCSIIAEYQYRINKYEESIRCCSQELSRTKTQLCSLNLKMEPFNSKMISCLDEIEYLKQKSEELVKAHIEELYFKNKEILRLNQMLECKAPTTPTPTHDQNRIIRTSFDTFGSNQNKELFAEFKAVIEGQRENHENQSCQKSEQRDSSAGGSNNCCEEQAPVRDCTAKEIAFVKRTSLMDVKQVMSIDGPDETYRLRYYQ